MNSKYKDKLFLIVCVTLIFNTVTEPIQMGFLGGPIGGKLVFYPLLIGMLYTFCCSWKYKNSPNIGLFIKYILIYIGVSLASLLLGLYTYPYWDLVLNGPVEQIEKLPKILAFFLTMV